MDFHPKPFYRHKSCNDTDLQSSWQGEKVGAEKPRCFCVRCEKSVMSDTGGSCKRSIFWRSIMPGNTSAPGKDGEPRRHGGQLWPNFLNITIKFQESDSKAALQPLRSSRSAALQSVPGQQPLTRVCLQRGFVFPSKLGVIPTLLLVLFINGDGSLAFGLLWKRRHGRKARFLSLSYVIFVD